MEKQQLNQTKSTVSSHQPKTATNTPPTTHPILQLQADIGNRAVNQLLKAQRCGNYLASDKPSHNVLTSHLSSITPSTRQPIQAKAMFRGLSQELIGELPLATSSGKTMPEAVQQKMETAFGTNFSNVRIHEGKEAESIGAVAYTRGRDIHFAPGKYDPISQTGQQLIGHELTHVVQQQAGQVAAPQGKGVPINADSRFENEADVLGAKAAQGETVRVSGSSSGIQCKGGEKGKGVIQRVQSVSEIRKKFEELEEKNSQQREETKESEEKREANRENWQKRRAAAHSDREAIGESETIGESKAIGESEAIGESKAIGESEIARVKNLRSKNLRPRSSKDKLKEIVWEGHLQAISDVCKKYKYTIAIRETGPLSIKRIAEGAKAKPHTILEKSIKLSSLQKGYEENAEKELKKLEQLDLDGFVGHWNANKLIGLRIDKIDEEIEKQITVIKDRGIPYVPLDMKADGGGIEIMRLKEVPNWQTYLYTGDYDLHEVYSLAGGGGGQIVEASKEKVNLLNRLNQGIANKLDPEKIKREGNATLENNRVHVEGDYAMFQHGDQATYRMNQHLEAKEMQKKEMQKKEMQKIVAKLVQQVATESNEPIAWCKRGEWFVTLNKEEHEVFRRKNKITKPHTWSNEENQKTLEGKKRTEVYQ